METRKGKYFLFSFSFFVADNAKMKEKRCSKMVYEKEKKNIQICRNFGKFFPSFSFFFSFFCKSFFFFFVNLFFVKIFFCEDFFLLKFWYLKKKIEIIKSIYLVLFYFHF